MRIARLALILARRPPLYGSVGRFYPAAVVHDAGIVMHGNPYVMLLGQIC